MDLRVSLRWPKRVLVILGLLIIGLWLKYDTEARTFRSAETTKPDAVRLDEEFACVSSHRPSEKPWCPKALESGVFGRIEIPRLGISAMIAEGTKSAQLNRAVEHVATTEFPGWSGNCVLAGHRDSSLRGLGNVLESDVIRIDTLQGTYTYLVEWGSVIEPHRVDVLDETATPSLTLVTCYPSLAVSSAPERFIVRARLVGPTEGSARQ